MPLTLIVFGFLKFYPSITEKYYSQGFFRLWNTFFRIMLGWLNFSLGLTLAFVFAPILVVIILKNFKKNKTWFINAFFYLYLIYFFYMLTWGLAYHKQPIDTLLDLNKDNIELHEISALAKELIDSTNYYKARLENLQNNSIEDKEIIEQATDSYQTLAKRNLIFSYNNKSIKKATGSNLLAYMGTSGIFFFPTGEANYNSNNLTFDLPYVITHEIAHQLGFASEDEANYVAYLACIKSKHPLFKYSAYYNVTYKAINTIWQADSVLAKSLVLKLSPSVRQDRALDKANWSRFENPLDTYIVGPFYDMFLKSNGQKDGSASYNKVVELLVAERRKKAL